MELLDFAEAQFLWVPESHEFQTTTKYTNFQSAETISTKLHSNETVKSPQSSKIAL